MLNIVPALAAARVLGKELQAATGQTLTVHTVLVVPGCRTESAEDQTCLLINLDTCGSFIGWRNSAGCLMEDDRRPIDKWLDERSRRPDRAARRAVLKGRKSRGRGRIASLQNLPPVRRLLAGQMRKQTSARANRAHYPAPFELIDAWEEHGDDPYGMMEEEAVRDQLVRWRNGHLLDWPRVCSDNADAVGHHDGRAGERGHVIPAVAY